MGRPGTSTETAPTRRPAPPRPLARFVPGARAEPEPRRGLAVDAHVEVEAAGEALGLGAASAGHVGEGVLDLDADPLDRLRVVAEDLDAELAADAGGQHL